MIGIKFGYDPDGNFIRYAFDVLDEEKVPGLVRYLENEYEKIIGFGSRFSTDLTRIPVILSKDKPTETYKDSDEIKARRIKRLFDRLRGNVTEEKILKIIKEKEKIFNILGRYTKDSNGNPVIYIYYKNISCESWLEYCSLLSQVLSHEYMHHIHYLNSPLFYKKDEFALYVKESLADFFSVLYLVYSNKTCNLNLNVAKKRYDEWDREFGSSWPYAEALWFYFIKGHINEFIVPFECYETYGMIKKFIHVLRISASSMKEAYLELKTTL